MPRLFTVFMSPDAKAVVSKVLDSGFVGQGEKVDEFETRLSEFLDRPVLTVNSGTSALDLALHLCDVHPGCEVVSTSITCTATNGVISNRGAMIIWADVDPYTGLISPESVTKNISPLTKAIMAVDWGGRLCDYSALKAHGIPVIEDAAHAFGSISTERGDYIAWSFQAIKHLTTGDGGAIATPASEFERARLLRWYGLDRRSSKSFRCEQNISEIGYKYHMNDIAASIGLANLPHMPSVIEAHRRNAEFYWKTLSSVPNLGVMLPRPDLQSSWWLYTLLVEPRDTFMNFMGERGIETSPVHARNDKHEAFSRLSRWADLPGLERFASRHVAIPVGWWLTDDDKERVVEAILEWSRA